MKEGQRCQHDLLPLFRIKHPPPDLDGVGHEVGQHLGEKGHEFGATTGRKRRCGWLDTVALRRSLQINSVTGMCITKLDVLDGLDTVKICVAYRLNGQEIDTPPVGADRFAQCEPIYNEMPGWKASTVGVKSPDELPEAARNYLDRIEALCETPIDIISTGPDREETIVLRDKLGPPCVLNKRFQTINGYLEVRDKQLFSHRPAAMLELFLIMAQHPGEIRGVRASTIRLIYQHLKLIDSRFRSDHKARRLFIEILSQPRGVTHVLRLMNRYGILAYYIPEFANIVGRMQYDLFHVYTVDTHTLFLVRNLRRFTVEKYRHEFPLCSEIMESIEQQELLMIAALFHDIAKGRGGDHAEKGARIAKRVCPQMGLSEEETETEGEV